ncbi:MAG: Uma2 family endonuclease [Thermodesulfobacteriota bacterium]
MHHEKIESMTEAEYLDRERVAEYKSEFFSGEMFAMTGASRNHNLIVTNLIRELSGQLKKTPCRVYPSDMRLKVEKTGLYTYPDVMVVCGEHRFADTEEKNTLLNPDVIVEVLSDSTEKYDRGDKFAHYRRIDSLTEYLLISQKKPKIERYFKNSTGLWTLMETDDSRSEILLDSIGCTLSLEEIYDKTDVS